MDIVCIMFMLTLAKMTTNKLINHEKNVKISKLLSFLEEKKEKKYDLFF